MSGQESTSSQLYTGSAEFGKFMALIGAIIGTVISIGLIIGGIFIIIYAKKLRSVEGSILADSKCTSTAPDKNGNITTTCVAPVKYTIDGTLYDDSNKKVSSGNITYKLGNSVTVWYNPTNPSEPILNPVTSAIGWVLIVIGIVIIFFYWLWVFITRKYKFAAAASGVSQGVGMLRGRW
jgi:hypothetical protein